MRPGPGQQAAIACLAAGLVACAAPGLLRWREPEHSWFQLYPGAMRPLAEVGVLCRESRSTEIASIRAADAARAVPARHESWHFPECIEAPPGVYVLEVHYFSRDTSFERGATITETTESAVPMTASWVAEAGGLYALRAVLGGMAPLPGLEPRRSRETEATQGRWYLRSWELEIERVPSWDGFGRPLLEYREAWRRYRD